MAESDVIERSVSMRKGNYCSKCGLEYRRWLVKIEDRVCEECNPKEYRKVYNKNIKHMKRRLHNQEHITEHTWFPKHDIGPYPFPDMKANKYNRREQK